jgi:hypothetical protein
LTRTPQTSAESVVSPEEQARRDQRRADERYSEYHSDDISELACTLLLVPGTPPREFSLAEPTPYQVLCAALALAETTLDELADSGDTRLLPYRTLEILREVVEVNRDSLSKGFA